MNKYGSITFKELSPAKNLTGSAAKDQVRVAFQRQKDKDGNITAYIMLLYIGTNVAKKINIEDGNKIAISAGVENPRYIFVRPAGKGRNGWTVSYIKNLKNRDALRAQITWNQFVPTEDEWPIRDVEFEYEEGGIVIAMGGLSLKQVK